jgi:glutamine amidotransferase
MKVVIIRYNAGNIESVSNALQRMGIQAEITGDHDKIRSADKVIFPGVGEASTTMEYLNRHGLDRVITGLRQPVLGICLGLQLLCAVSEEGNTPCLGIFSEKVRKLSPDPERKFIDKVPHMGWNSIQHLKNGIFSSDMEGRFVYFVHSYYAETGEDTSAVCSYINPFSAALQKGNFYATQFHPEKSGQIGAEILWNFINL